MHPLGIFCEIYSDRSVVAPNFTYIDLSRSHYTEAPYDRKPWGDRVQLYRHDDFEQKVIPRFPHRKVQARSRASLHQTNLVGKVMKHEDALAAHALAQLQETLQNHLRATAPT